MIASRCLTMLLTFLFSFLLAIPTCAPGATPCVYWASTPVRPDETVMVHGSDLGGAGAVVELARLEDADATAPAALPPISQWTPVPVLQGNDQTLKFVVPATWKMGVFACRLTIDGTATEPLLLNAPDPWWAQGNEGDSATPGGWLRVLGKSLGVGNHGIAILQPDQGPVIVLQPMAADGYSMKFNLPAQIKPGQYTVHVHNGAGGNASWRSPGTIRIVAATAIPSATFSVLEMYGPDALAQMRNTLVKYNQPMDRTEGILAALQRAKDNGGGIVYFPPGRYRINGPMAIPDHTILRGDAMGLVTLWWGSGHFNLDGGGPQGRALVEEPKPPHTLISGSDFAIENMSLYLPFEYEQGIVSDNRLRMDHVRIRVDHYWLVQGRGNGTVVRLGRNFQVMNCDILAKGDALAQGQFGILSHNRVMSNKSSTPMGGSRNIIVEDNQFVSMDPTAYQNISGFGRNIYYAHNRHEALYAQQSDFSFTFDAGTGAYIGKLAETNGTHITLAADPVYPKWAPETHGIWKRSALCIVDGRGVGQWRDVTAGHDRAWEIDRPFDTAPDATSVATIISFNGRVLVIGNQFEDANWVNAGYGTSIDVVYAENHLARCADLMNYGLHSAEWGQPSWNVQYFDNEAAEGQTHIGSSGDSRKSKDFAGPLTRWCIHRRQALAADNSGSITITGNLRDAIVEGCSLQNPASNIKVDAAPQGVILRNNSLTASPSSRYTGEGIRKAVVQ